MPGPSSSHRFLSWLAGWLAASWLVAGSWGGGGGKYKSRGGRGLGKQMRFLPHSINDRFGPQNMSNQTRATEYEQYVSAKLTRFPQAHSTDVVLSSLCPPRRWSDAGVGIKMLRGIPLLSAN